MINQSPYDSFDEKVEYGGVAAFRGQKPDPLITISLAW